MKGYVNVFDILDNKKRRVAVEVTAVHDDGSYDYVGEHCKGINALMPLFNETGDAVTPTVEAKTDTVGELAKKIVELEKDVQAMKKTKQAQ